MTDYTEQEVRKMARFAHVDGLPETVTEKMLTQLADMLREREKAVPYCYTCEQKNGLSQGAMCRTRSECEMSPLYDPEQDHIIPLFKHPAAQPRVVDGFVFERVNMGRGDECYVGLSDGSLGTTITKNGHSEFDTAGQLLWRIADALLAAQEGRSRE